MYVSSFSISGYRSLLNVQIRDMRRVCIFHGLNNTGKSNILSALETIFARKVWSEETQTAAEGITTHERQGGFWRGRIPHFRDNFYQGRKDDITFAVSITFEHNELAFLHEHLAKLAKHFAKPEYEKKLILSGKMKYLDDDTADMVLESAKFNNEVVFELGLAGAQTYFPKLKALNRDVQLRLFETLMNLLSDSFAVLPSDRHLTAEAIEDASNKVPVLTPKTFKNWLFTLSLTRSGHPEFESIKKMFSDKPFSCGEIGFSKERGEIEIMVQNSATRLPITRLGSGHQQMLYIIATVVRNKGKMLGIEELEINLSPAAQRFVFEKLKEFVFKGSGMLTQVIITSHSEVFEVRGDVRCYSVTHDGDHTSVASWTQAARHRFFLPPPR